MLYDILIIDDDFEGAAESKDYANNANKLLCDFIRENLRVTWTTGELEDLRRLTAKDLSAIRYIFMDLHLSGTSSDTSKIKDINAKLLNIVKKITPNIKSEKVACYINSKYKDNYDEQAKESLKQAIEQASENKFTLEFIPKNKLTKGQRKTLRLQSMVIHTRHLIISKALETEEIMDRKLGLNDELKTLGNFSSKMRVFEKMFCTDDEDTKKRLQDIRKKRNEVAHGDKPIFKNLDALAAYIQDIEELKSDLEKKEIQRDDG